MVQVTKFIWMNGKFVKWNDAKVHITTHALHYGSAVFEGIRSYNTDRGAALFRLDDHLGRLFYSAKALGIKIKFTENEIKDVIKKLLKMNNLENAYVRPLAYHGYGSIGVYPDNVTSEIAIIAVPDYIKDTKRLRLATSSYVRPSDKSTAFGAKISGNYANSILAMKAAREKGYDEALMVGSDGFVAEGPAENLFVIKNKVLTTPSSRSALYGFTRDTLLKISKDINIKSKEKRLTLNEVKNSDEAFFCGTGKEISPIISIDNHKIGNGKAGKITSQLKDLYFDIARGRNKKYSKWLTYV